MYWNACGVPRWAAAVVFCAVAFDARAQCSTEPLLLLEDAAGDYTGTVDAPAGSPEYDLLSLHLAQAPAADGDVLLTFTLKTGGFGPTLPPSAAWYTSFENAEGLPYGVRMQTDELGTPSYFSYRVGAANGGQTDGRFVDDGTEKPAVSGSFAADGTITISILASKVAAEPGQTIGPFNAAVVQTAVIAAFTVDEMPDGLGRDGFFDIGNCGGKSAGSLVGAGSLGFAMLAPLGLLALRRRALTGLVLAGFAGTGIAADPASGTISEGTPELRYTFPIAPIANVSGLVGLVPGQPAAYTCGPATPCDEFALTIDLPANYLDTYPDVQVRVAAATTEKDLDIDLQVANEDGTVEERYVTRDNPPEQPTVRVIPKGGVEKFIVQVTHGTPHTGGEVLIRLEPGDAAKSGSVLGGATGTSLLFALAGLGLLRQRTRRRA